MPTADARTPVAIRPFVLGALLTTSLAAQDTGDVVIVRGERVTIRESCVVHVVELPKERLSVGEEGAGVITIAGDDLRVRFKDPLDGRRPGEALHELRGVGILVTGKNVTLQNAVVRGFKVGIHARSADGLVLEDSRVEANFAQRLGSTPQAEDSQDWLWPHVNDGHEWMRNYGAGIYIERSNGVVVRRCRARKGQNGLILDRVGHAEIYDNDFSFLSGWGIAMWRSSDNIVCRNATDFCVRGYSHGVYNRGQDSAGILMFEQNERNVIAENSGTHSGDGFFGFAGKEALGEHDPPEGFDYRRKGNLDNLILANDFSYAVAHGIEMTFSFGNVIRENRLTGNAICGIWGGYSKDTTIVDNLFERNGDMPYGLERGGINIEHGERNRIVRNTFVENACGVHLWWDPDEGLTKLPWSKANGHGCGQTLIADNTFAGDQVGVQLRECPGVEVSDNRFSEVQEETLAEDSPTDASDLSQELPTRAEQLRALIGERELPGKKRAVGARAHLAGRDKILMTEYGPYDWQSTLLQFVGTTEGGGHEYRLLGPGSSRASAEIQGAQLETQRERGYALYRVLPATEARAASYRLRIAAGNTTLEKEGVLLPLRWRVRSFAWTHDPREDMIGWMRDSNSGVEFHTDRLLLPFKMAGPSQLPSADEALVAHALPSDRFGTLAHAEITLPKGRWTLESTSDDGIRVSVDDDILIDDWTWHAPKTHEATFEIEKERTVALTVYHFELDGYAILSVKLTPAE